MNLEHVEVRMAEFVGPARSEPSGRAVAPATTDAEYPMRSDAHRRGVAEKLVDEGEPDEDSQWVSAIRAGNERAFDRLFRRHVTGLIRYAARIVSSDAEAQDIVMEAFTRLWRDRSSLAADIRLMAYLKVIVRNSCIDHLRHDRLVTSVEELGAEGGWSPGMSAAPLMPDEELERTATKESIRLAFVSLPLRMRQVLELRWLADKSYKDISRELGMPVKSVENYLGRAMRLLRDRMRRES